MPPAAIAGQPGRRLLVEAGREVGDDQDPVRLGHLAGHGVVLLDRGVFVAEVLLGDLLHVRGEVGQPLVDLPGVGPDLAGDERLVEVGQVHERAKFRPMPIGVDDREPDLPGGRLVSSRNIAAWRTSSAGARALGRGLDQQVGPRGKAARRGKVERPWGCLPSAGGRRDVPPGSDARARRAPCRSLNHRRELLGVSDRDSPTGVVPFGAVAVDFAVDGVQPGGRLRHALLASGSRWSIPPFSCRSGSVL